MDSTWYTVQLSGQTVYTEPTVRQVSTVLLKKALKAKDMTNVSCSLNLYHFKAVENKAGLGISNLPPPLHTSLSWDQGGILSGSAADRNF